MTTPTTLSPNGSGEASPMMERAFSLRMFMSVTSKTRLTQALGEFRATRIDSYAIFGDNYVYRRPG